MGAQTLAIAGPGRRMLDVELSGPGDGMALIFHAGTPSAGSMLIAMAVERLR